MTDIDMNVAHEDLKPLADGIPVLDYIVKYRYPSHPRPHYLLMVTIERMEGRDDVLDDILIGDFPEGTTRDQAFEVMNRLRRELDRENNRA